MDNIPHCVLLFCSGILTSTLPTLSAAKSGLYNASCPIMDYSSLLSRPISYFGQEQVWIARGDDVLLFNSHRSNIQNYLKHSAIPESTQSSWIGLYRIGRSQNEARTVLVVSCSDRRIRKLTRNVLRNSPIFQEGGDLARFRIISKATLPETASEPELTMQVDRDASLVPPEARNRYDQNVSEDVHSHAQSEITIHLDKSQTGDRYLCRRIQASQWSQDGVSQSQTATAGPLLSLGGSNYQLTVEHVVNFSNHGADTTPRNTVDDWDSDEEDDDDDGDGCNDCSLDEEIAPWDICKAGIRRRTNSMTEGNVSDSASSNTVPEPVVRSSNHDLSSITQANHSRPSAFIDLNLARRGKTRDVIIHDVLSPLNSFKIKTLTQCRASSEIDYLLIPIPLGFEKDPLIHVTAEMKQTSDAFNVHEQTEPRSVIIATAALGYVNGIMFPASTLTRKAGSKSFQTYLCIKSHENMPKGTSGSAVFDTQTGLLAGYIVLGCPEKDSWYMAPITDVIDDIKTSYGIDARCQTRLNVSAIVKQNQESGTISGCIDRLPLDQCHKQFGFQGRIAGKAANDQPFLDRTNQQDPQISEVLGFMSPHPHSSRWDRRVSAIETFCEPTFPPFDDSILGSSKIYGTGHSLQPKIWISDSNGHSSHSPARTIPDANKLYETLMQKRPLNWDSDTALHRHRLIYISNPDPACILALMRTAPQSQVGGFQELFHNYITESPKPSISQSYWLGTNSFVMSFNFPFYVIGTPDQNGNNTTSSKIRSLRRCYSLSFSNTDNYKSRVQQDRTCVREVMYSIVVTGENDRYWTAVCLNDEFLNEEPYEHQQRNKDALEIETDPIIAEQGTEATDPVFSPRAYALLALSVQCERIVDYHTKLQDHMQAIFDSYITDSECDFAETATSPATRQWRTDYRNVLSQAIYANLNICLKVSEFLGIDLMCNPKGLPLAPMWMDTQTDLNALNSLRRIRKSHKVLLQLDKKLNKLLSTHDKFERRSYNLHHHANVTHDQRMERFTLAAFVLGILNLVAQVNAGRSEGDNEILWPEYVTMVTCFIVLAPIGLWAFMRRRLDS